MKINKKDPKHWTFLVLSSLYVFIAILCRPFRKRNRVKQVVLYGHQLNGNIKAFADYCTRNSIKDMQLYFAADPDYLPVINKKRTEIPILSMNSLRDIIKIGACDAIITTHGTHALYFLLRLTNIKFCDVWHGIPFKGWGRDSFKKEQVKYDEVWVSSPTIKRKYIDMYDFPESIIQVTGYARTDDLINDYFQKQQLLKKYKIDGFKKYILVAPTWKQDDAGRSIVPFGVNTEDFFKTLNNIGEKLSALVIFRAHLNSGDGVNTSNLSFVHVMPHTSFPVTEEFLAIADELVTDWSSIAFDYLVLQRPTIFLDVPSPFAEGFTLGPEYRFGPVVNNLHDLQNTLVNYGLEPQQYLKDFKNVLQKANKAAYGSFADGKAAKRYYERLHQVL